MPSRKESRAYTAGGVLYLPWALVSVGSSRPASTGIPAGWRHYDTGGGRIEFWDGAQWARVSPNPGAYRIPQADSNGDINNTWIKYGGAASLLRTNNPVTPASDPNWHIIAANEIVCRVGTLGNVDGLLLGGHSLIARRQASEDLTAISCSGSNNLWCGRGAASGGDLLAFHAPSRVLQSFIDSGDLAGTAFPSTAGAPQDGYPFYHQTHGQHFVYDGGWSAWLSTHEWTHVLGNSGTTGTGYLNMQNGVASSATYGFSFPWDVKCVMMSVCASASATGTWQVYDDGTGVTGATISLAAATQASTNLLTGSATGTITANSIIAINQTAGASVDDPIVTAVFRRYAT